VEFVFTEIEHGFHPVIRTLNEKIAADHVVIKPNEAFELRLGLTMPRADELEQQEEMKDYYRAEIDYASKNQSFGLDKHLFPSWKIMALNVLSCQLICKIIQI
jgi:hypothetical protein